MITYVDSSVLGRAYLPDEPGSQAATDLLRDPEVTLVTSSLTKVDVTGLLVRAVRAGRCDPTAPLAALRTDLGPTGPITELSWPQRAVEQVALEITEAHGVRALDALHVAVAHLAGRALAGDGPVAFATRDAAQAAVAEAYGFICL